MATGAWPEQHAIHRRYHWTIVLGVVFIIQVSDQLSMPDLRVNVLGRMGISSGTYLGFKLPSASSASAPAKTS